MTAADVLNAWFVAGVIAFTMATLALLFNSHVLALVAVAWLCLSFGAAFVLAVRSVS